MVQPADPRNRDHGPHFFAFDLSLVWRVLLQPEMGSVRVVVVDVSTDRSSKLTLIDRDHMIQAISP